MSDVGVSVAQMRVAAATNLLLLGFDAQTLEGPKARPEDVLRAPLDHRKFEVLLHFLLSSIYPADAVRAQY